MTPVSSPGTDGTGRWDSISTSNAKSQYWYQKTHGGQPPPCVFLSPVHIEGARRPEASVMKALLLLISIAVPAAVRAQGDRTINGMVVDPGNKPLSGVAVYLDRDDTDVRTGKDGSFKVHGPSDEITLVVRKPGWIPVAIRVPAGGE